MIFLCLLAVTILLQISFIFSNSLQDAVNSDNQSDVFVRFAIEKILGLDYESQNDDFLGTVSFVIRKIAHFCEYGLLGILVFLFIYIYSCSVPNAFFITVQFCFVIGIVDEFLQRFSEGRSPSFVDALIDVSGALTACVGMMLIIKIIQIFSKRKNNCDLIMRYK